MSWPVAMQNARKALDSPLIPSSLELISLIKQVNPTTVSLSGAERELGYAMKSSLQNLLLEQYGEAFCLDPHPLNPNIVLIQHAALPSIDACHAELAALSCKALICVAPHDPAPAAKESSRKPRKVKRDGAADGNSPPDVLKRAQLLLAEYDFAAAEELLCGLRISDCDDLVFVEQAARVLLEEIGAYQQAIELLLAQQNQFLRDSRLRVLLARAYHLSGALPEARAIFDDLHQGELDKEALVAYADIAHKDGNPLLAQKLLKAAGETRGYAVSLDSLNQEVESVLHAQAEPLLQRAFWALNGADRSKAEHLAREVLQFCPNHQRAREMVARIDSDKKAVEVAALWERLAQAELIEERLEILERLSGRDPENKERITGLIAIEKNRQQKESAKARLERLRTLVQETSWPEAFDVVRWLQDQADQDDDCRQVCSISPYLSVLYENKRLRRLSQRSARQLWLDLVQAMTSVASGHPDGCLKILEEVKHYFEKYAVFSEVYHRALRYEQEKAREEIKGLLLVASREGASLSQAQACFSAVRRAMVPLPAEERAEYYRIQEARIAELAPPVAEEELIEAYKYVARSGNHAKAAVIRSSISDQAVLDQFDSELLKAFAIERSPVCLEFSDTLEVDLLSAQPLIWIGSTDRHLLLREAEDVILIVHLEKMKATRFVSPYFKDLHIADFISQDDTFLFNNVKDPLPWWRVELSDEKSAFTACFEITDFCEQEDDGPVAVFLSSERVTDYYALILDIDGVKPGRAVRKRLGSRSPVSDSIKIGNKVQTQMMRLSCHPDKFIIGAEDEMDVCAKNLTSDFKVDMPPKDVWALDLANGHLYYFDRALLKRTDLTFDHTERFLNSSGCYFFNEHHQKLGLCPSTSTLMLGFGLKAALYDFVGNRLSSPFGWGRVIGTRPARKWYSYDYCKETRALILRDVTGELSTLLQWEEPEVSPERKEKNPDWHIKLHEQIYFGYQGTDAPEEPQVASSPSAPAAPGSPVATSRTSTLNPSL